MKNTLKLIIILLFTITFSSCKNEVQKRIELIEKKTDSLNKSLDNIKDIKQITLANEKVKLIKDSIYKNQMIMILCQLERFYRVIEFFYLNYFKIFKQFFCFINRVCICNRYIIFPFISFEIFTD